MRTNLRDLKLLRLDIWSAKTGVDERQTATTTVRERNRERAFDRRENSLTGRRALLEDIRRLAVSSTVLSPTLSTAGWFTFRERINAAPFLKHFSHWHRGPTRFRDNLPRALLESTVSIVKFN